MLDFARLGVGCLLAAAAAAGSCSSSRSASLAPTSPTESTPAPLPTARGIAVLGDSLAVSPSRPESFPAELQKRVDAAATGWIVDNEGVSGDTAAGGRRRFDAAVDADARILLLALGANDGLRGRPIASVEDDLSAIIERAQGRGIRVLLCGMETPPFHSVDYSVEFHRLFPRLAAKYGLSLVPFLLDGVALNPEMNLPDLIHPNVRGAKRIAENVWPKLQLLVEEVSATGMAGARSELTRSSPALSRRR